MCITVELVESATVYVGTSTVTEFTKRIRLTPCMPLDKTEPLDTVTVECICKNILNSNLSKHIYTHEAAWA